MMNEETMFVVNTWFHYFAVEGNFDKNDFEGCVFFESESEMLVYLVSNSYCVDFEELVGSTYRIVKDCNEFNMVDDRGNVWEIETPVPKFISEFCL